MLTGQTCCVAAAGLSRTRDLEAHLAPLATTLVEVNLPNEASVDCIAYFLQVSGENILHMGDTVYVRIAQGLGSGGVV